MTNELTTQERSTNLVAIIIDADQQAEAMRQQMLKFQQASDDARAKLLEMFKGLNLKTIKLETGLQVTAATRETMKIVDEPKLIAYLDEMSVSGVLTEVVPERREVKTKMLKDWIKEKGETFIEQVPGIEVNQTSYITIKK